MIGLDHDDTLTAAAGHQAEATRAAPVLMVVPDSPIIKVPGCPPFTDAITGVIACMLTLDRQTGLDHA